ncbi:transcriptional repressor [Clostridium botulinum]|uniref:Fur family transcriptional regulator n=1 Tax=Clostridium TaxID=1485 RepID=UPI000500BCB8|nr:MULTISPECIES: Fur family transcriptional regulator [unclassified Clostridium]AIY78963.1 ferric uptake regulator family protein [Clostridium botulinum 202F]KAI3346483.1 transcriptional repressor [Clostridium botulinum]KFX54819.1 Fur family transcriptional regulator [Clostridium botulinum]KFX58739.1 Fur family transcriptional regulator [Clostridium botulinum]KON13005.1 Fur family transcriptional regulator [Clostridium botulinum]
MDLKEFLKNKNIKVTKGRVEILEILRISNNSLSAEKIYQICRCDNININLSTIYRTLELFEEKDIIDKIVLEDGVFSYKLKKKTHMHFLKCDICHKEVEIPCPMIQIQELVENKTGFTLTEHNLILKGICQECKKNK